MLKENYTQKKEEIIDKNQGKHTKDFTSRNISNRGICKAKKALKIRQNTAHKKFQIYFD